ncbi:DUF6389 family protein [Rhodospirillum sp. A1_3_36]|uniref:DUF6389 family protein n=1 Tax=Rhodospirillum sp. A1_3_36 TaxID=3391666 RepID=UPI0039A4C8B6
MDPASYQRDLLEVLGRNMGHALDALRAFDLALPETAQSIEIVVHVNQEQDGLFTIMSHLNGPDSYALNKAIRACSILFDVRMVDGEPQPKVPLFDPSNIPFGVNDVIVDTAVSWVVDLWKAFGGTSAGLPAIVIGGDGYGTKGVTVLSP